MEDVSWRLDPGTWVLGWSRGRNILMQPQRPNHFDERSLMAKLFDHPIC